MTGRPLIIPGAMPSRDANGRVLPARLRFWVPGTNFSTPATIYSDQALTVPVYFEILSDLAGRWPQMWADDTLSFDVGWFDQVTLKQLGEWTDLSPAEDATLASVDMAQGAAEEAAASAAAAEAAALLAEAYVANVSGQPFQATSSTPNVIGTGTKVFTLDQPGVLFHTGQTVVAASRANGNNQMTGVVMSLVGAILTVSMASLGTGVGNNYSDWQISLSSSGGVQSLAGLQGIITDVAGRTALDVPSNDQAQEYAIIFSLIF